MNGIFTHIRERLASSAPPVQSALPPKSSGNNVLVVDDDKAICRIVQFMLSDEQYQVQTSQSVADAYRAIEEKPFDAYLLTTNCRTVPDSMSRSGFGRRGGEAPIILMSGYDASAIALRAEKFRIFDFLQKPFSREMICNAVKKAIGLPKGALA